MPHPSFAKVLAIESSCDETAAAVLKDGGTVLSNVVASQVDIHKEYGGIVPELASRHHLEAIEWVVRQALAEAGVGPQELEGIAVTQGPGLVGSLVVGFSFAKAMAAALAVPFTGVNHVMAHLLSVFLGSPSPSFPYIGLVVSGGHTSLYQVHNFLSAELMGQTRDDAAGEAFDKVAKLLGLGYPGGPVISKLAEKGKRDAFSYPRARLPETPFDFSFSGLKTSVLVSVNKISGQEQIPVADICASFEEAVVDVLVHKTINAAQSAGIGQVVVTGGVAANRRLRQKMEAEGRAKGIESFFPPLEMCTDNAAMVAFAGFQLLKNGILAQLEADVYSRLPTFSLKSRHINKR